MFEFPKPGEAFDGFEILEEVGEGAFARVYKGGWRRTPTTPWRSS